jgi:hypothetical protein
MNAIFPIAYRSLFLGVILLSTNRGTGLASEEVGMHSLQLFLILAAQVLAGRSAGRARQDFIT